MSSNHLSSKADGDIDDVVDYSLETWGESQAHNYVTIVVGSMPYAFLN